MTEQTTTATDLLDFIRIAVRLGNNRKAHEAICDLDSSLTSGSTLPEQWPHAKELEELRAKVARIERIDTALETQYIDAQLKIVEMKEELDRYSYHTKLSLELGERYVQQESEMTQKIIAQRAELASLKAKVAKYEEALGEIAGYRLAAIENCQGINHEDVKIIEAIARTVLEP